MIYIPKYDGIVDRGRAVGVGPSRKAKLQSIIISKWHLKKNAGTNPTQKSSCDIFKM
jgi:hypothetical protein